VTSYNVFIGLGANMGDRFTYLKRAVDALKIIRETSVIWISSIYEAEPWGKKEQPKFLNAAAQLTTALDPPALLAELKRIEQELGRVHHDHWGPREIDLDILVYDGVVHEEPDVHVPHSELAGRRFALVPLREIAPDLVHPVSGLTVTEMAAACADQGRVVQTPYHIPL
jgi:2-amino-4-hydroxy-6-hydroxymethyldihydropteridine diphosphokinase